MGTMNFDAVETGGHRSPGRLDEALDDVLDIEPAHHVRQGVRLPGERVVLLRSEPAGGDGAPGRIDLGPGHPAAVEHLHDRHGTGGTDLRHHRRPGIDLPLRGQAGLPRVALGAFVVGDKRLGVDQCGTMLRAAYQEVEHILAGDAVPE